MLRHLMSSWNLNTFDYLKNERSFQSEIKSIFLVSQVLSFRHTKQTNRNIADTTFKEKWWNWKNWSSFVAAPPEKNKPLPLIHQISSRISKVVQPSPVPPLIQKGGGRHRQQSIVLYLLDILVYVCISTMYCVESKDT